MRLVVVPDSDRVEQWLLDESRASEFVDLRGVCNFSQLIDRCEPGLFAKRVAADELVTRLVFGQAARARPGPFGALAATPDFARQVCLLVNELRANDAEPWQLAQAAAKCAPGVRDRAVALSEIWRHADEALAAQGLIAAGEWTRLAAQRLEATETLPPALQGSTRIEVRDLHDVPLSRLRFLKALAKACHAAKVAFHWSWPAAGESNADAFIIEAVRHAEAGWSQEELALERDVAEAPLAWVARELFTAEPVRRRAETLSAFVAPTAREELRELARRVRASVSAGVPPESIAVVFRELAADTEPLLEALAELGVPARARLGVPLGRSAPGRAALALLELADRAFPADEVAAVLESPFVKALPDEAAEPRRAFREAGLRDDALGAVGHAGAYEVRLAALAKRSGDGARGVTLLSDAVKRLMAEVRGLAEEAPASELLDAWWAALSKLGLLSAPRAFSRHHDAELLRAEALAAAAASALGELLTSLKSALRVSGAGPRVLRRADFARWVRDAAEDVNLEAQGARAGAVWLLEARELAGRRFAQVFVGGLIDGRWPGRASPAALLSDEERVALNRALGKALFRVTVGENDVRLPARLAEDRLLFHFALSAGAAVTVSRSRFDASGREVLASPFVEALRRCVEGFHEEPILRSVVAPLDEVQCEEEFRVRAALEALSPVVTRQTVPDARGAALAKALRDESWFMHARAQAAAEAERLRFFSDESQPAGEHSGHVEGALLSQRLRFDAAHPLSSHEMQNWARCAFRGLAAQVVGLEVSEAAGEDLDARVRGSLWHEALALAVPKLRDAKLLGRPSAQARALVEESVNAAAEKLEARSSIGHPALWALARDWSVRVINAAVATEKMKPFGLPEPKLFEAAFGSAKSLPELREVKLPLEPPVFLHGRMDRVDVAPGSLGVIDYKTSVSKTLKRDFLVVEFQMAFYLLAARQLEPGAALTGAWLGLGRNELSKLWEPAGEIFTKLHAAVGEVLTALRSGDFGPRPALECGTCEYKAVCRISQRKLLDDAP